ncbi:MAG: twin-arginine translocase subunit TatB [Proteobacteria bacterium]|nr:twin-arginine translocase subunit TatB [Pseudomonadota bacterium]
MFFEGKALEFLIAAVVALVVVGPKDLPILLRKFGQFMARVRSMAAEFRASFDEMARQSELDELRKEVEAMRRGQLGDLAQHTTSPEMTQTFNEISQGLSDVGVSLNEPVVYPYTPAQTEHVEIAPVEAPKKPRKAPVKKAATAKSATSKAAPSKAAKPKAANPRTPTVSGGKAPAARKATPAKADAAKARPRARKATVS